MAGKWFLKGEVLLSPFKCEAVCEYIVGLLTADGTLHLSTLRRKWDFGRYIIHSDSLVQKLLPSFELVLVGLLIFPRNELSPLQLALASWIDAARPYLSYPLARSIYGARTRLFTILYSCLLKFFCGLPILSFDLIEFYLRSECGPQSELLPWMDAQPLDQEFYRFEELGRIFSKYGLLYLYESLN